jgi:hypothetical protein
MSIGAGDAKSGSQSAFWWFRHGVRVWRSVGQLQSLATVPTLWCPNCGKTTPSFGWPGGMYVD